MYPVIRIMLVISMFREIEKDHQVIKGIFIMREEGPGQRLKVDAVRSEPARNAHDDDPVVVLSDKCRRIVLLHVLGVGVKEDVHPSALQRGDVGAV